MHLFDPLVAAMVSLLVATAAIAAAHHPQHKADSLASFRGAAGRLVDEEAPIEEILIDRSSILPCWYWIIIKKVRTILLLLRLLTTI